MSAEAISAVPQRNIADPAVARDRVILRRAPGTPSLRYYLYWPSVVVPGQSALVAVHGISLNGREQARAFAAQAATVGAVILAPLFEPDTYRDYQRMGRAGRGARADLALLAMLADAAAVTGQTFATVNLFGFSGGAQFCHRFTMAHPQVVRRQVLAAAGWYTFPTHRQRFPLGLSLRDELPGIELLPAAFLQVPTCVLVGELDTERDAALRRGKRIDRLQGENRIARGRQFVARMRKAADKHGLSASLEFAILPGCGHDFDDCARRGDLIRRALAFLYEQPRPEVETQQ